MIALDLCCGKGGWAHGLIAAGWTVIGFDTEPQPDYPGTFIQADARTVRGWAGFGASLIVASPPCEQFSRHQMPWTRAKNPPPPDLSIVDACRNAAKEAGAPLILENVRAAQGWLGRAAYHAGAFYLWGDVPALMPKVTHRKKESFGSAKRLERAMVPFDLAKYIGVSMRPA